MIKNKDKIAEKKAEEYELIQLKEKEAKKKKEILAKAKAKMI